MEITLSSECGCCQHSILQKAGCRKKGPIFHLKQSIISKRTWTLIYLFSFNRYVILTGYNVCETLLPFVNFQTSNSFTSCLLVTSQCFFLFMVWNYQSGPRTTWESKFLKYNKELEPSFVDLWETVNHYIHILLNQEMRC